MGGRGDALQGRGVGPRDGLRAALPTPIGCKKNTENRIIFDFDFEIHLASTTLSGVDPGLNVDPVLDPCTTPPSMLVRQILIEG